MLMIKNISTKNKIYKILEIKNIFIFFDKKDKFCNQAIIFFK